MVRQDLRDKMVENGFENSIVYDYPSFDNSIIGVDVNGKTIYAYPLMVDEYVKDETDDIENLTEDEFYEKRTEAMEFIDYNTIRATPYMGAAAPIVIDFNPESEGYYDMVSGNEYNMDEVDLKIEDKYKEFVEYYY